VGIIGMSILFILLGVTTARLSRKKY
jgi:hypothetical protein